MARRQRAARSSITRAGTRDPELPGLRPEIPAYVLDFYVDADGRMPALEWLRSLEPLKRFEVGHAMDAQLQQDGLGGMPHSLGNKPGQWPCRVPGG